MTGEAVTPLDRAKIEMKITDAAGPVYSTSLSLTRSCFTMNVFSASAMGMMFESVPFDDLLEGDTNKFSQAQSDIAGRFGSLIASLGGFAPALQQMFTDTMLVRYPNKVRHLVENEMFVMKDGQKLAQVRDYSGKFSSHAVHVSGASQIAASTVSAVITMCHIVADYDCALKLAVADAKLDELLKVHNREYTAELESLYNWIGDLFMKSVRGHVITTDLEHCSQQLDRLVLIWLIDIIDQLKVNTSTKHLKTWVNTQKSLKYCMALPVAAVLTGGTTLISRQVYSKWIHNINCRLNKVDSLMRLMGIAVWLRKVISHHTGSRQSLFDKYSNKLQTISTAASNIKKAVVRTQKLMAVDQTITHLEWVETLPERIRVLLTHDDFHQNSNIDLADPAEAKYGVEFDSGSNSFSLHAVK